MNLPDLAWQLVYGRIAWAIVITMMLVATWPGERTPPRGALIVILAASIVLVALPDEASIAYWLSLAFQYPSGLLLGLCMIKLYSCWQGMEVEVMPVWLATTVAILGTILYLDAIGWLSQGFYYVGFSPLVSPAAALCGTALLAFAILRRRGGLPSLALMGALQLFILLRLPTGNLWDAVLDPLLWAWALVTLGRWGRRRLAQGLRHQLGGGTAQAGRAVAHRRFRG